MLLFISSVFLVVLAFATQVFSLLKERKSERGEQRITKISAFTLGLLTLTLFFGLLREISSRQDDLISAENSRELLAEVNSLSKLLERKEMEVKELEDINIMLRSNADQLQSHSQALGSQVEEFAEQVTNNYSPIKHTSIDVVGCYALGVNNKGYAFHPKRKRFYELCLRENLMWSGTMSFDSVDGKKHEIRGIWRLDADVLYIEKTQQWAGWAGHFFKKWKSFPLYLNTTVIKSEIVDFVAGPDGKIETRDGPIVNIGTRKFSINGKTY